MHDNNFKISLTSLRIIHNLWMKYPKEINNVLPDLVKQLSTKLSDNKIVIRHAVLKVFHVLCVSLGAKDIIKLVFPFLKHENWHIREEILSILIMAWITSNSTWGLSDPKMISQVWALTNDDKDKVSQTAFETLWIILSKDSSTAIILNNYLDPQIYNAISERCFSGKLASVNYDGIVEFPTPQTNNSNHLLYSSGYSRDQESKSVHMNSDNKMHMKSADHTAYSQNFQMQNPKLDERPKVMNFAQPNFDKSNSTTSSIGNKMWLPGFNMTASSIKSEQSVRVSKEPIMQTPVQYTNKITNERKSDRMINNTISKNLDYTPETHQNKPRRFGNINNPSMTAHSMNVASTNMNSMQQTVTKTQISQNEYYEDSKSSIAESQHTEYNNGNNFRKSRPMDYRSEKAIVSNQNTIPTKGPIKPVGIGGNAAQSAIETEPMHTGFSNFDDDSLTENRQHRYSQMSNKSLESRNRAKNSLSQKKPPLKNKKFRDDGSERAHSIDARNQDIRPEKALSPEGQWKNVLSMIQNKKDWEGQFKACNIIKDFSSQHKSFFRMSDMFFSEIMNELSTLWNSLRTQLSRNALGTFAIIFENLGRKIDWILDTVIPMLLKKAADTNAFIAEEAEKALVKAWENCSESKLVSAALSLSKIRTNGVKEKILVAINTIIEKLQEKIKTFKDRERIVSFLATGMNEAALEVRNAAKSGFLILKATLSNSEFERLIMKSTSDKNYAKVIDFLEKESTGTDKFMITNGISTKGTFYYNKTRMSKVGQSSNDYGDLESTGSRFSKTKSSIYNKKNSTSSGYGKSSNFELISSEIMDKFQDIIKTFEDTDWRKRISALKSLSSFIQEEDKLINKSK